MNRRHALASALFLTAGLAACAASAPPATSASTHKTQPLGADRDAHGCIGSAGYAWCEGTGTCERPWELASRQGFANTREAFEAYCGKPAAR